MKMAPKMEPLAAKGRPRGDFATQGGPEIDKDGLRDPFGARVTSMMVSGCDPAFGKLAFFALPGRTWSLQGPILDPRGVPKRFQNLHGEARSAPLAAKVGQKALPKGVPKWGRKSDRKDVPK